MVDCLTLELEVMSIEQSSGAFADHSVGGVAGFDARTEQAHGRDPGQ